MGASNSTPVPSAPSSSAEKKVSSLPVANDLIQTAYQKGKDEGLSTIHRWQMMVIYVWN